jgi:hypothetical protein
MSTPKTALVLGDAPNLASWRRHHYAGKLLAQVASGEIPLVAGEVTWVDVYHDGDCPALSGGVCDCDPDVRLRGDPRDN